MIHLHKEIIRALETNSVLLSLLGGKRIYHLVAPKADEFPRVTFFEITNINDRYAEDTALTSRIQIQIDVWHKSSTTPIVREIDKTTKVHGFKRISTADLYEDDTKIFHYAMRYETNRILEEE